MLRIQLSMQAPTEPGVYLYIGRFDTTGVPRTINVIGKTIHTEFGEGLRYTLVDQNRDAPIAHYNGFWSEALDLNIPPPTQGI